MEEQLSDNPVETHYTRQDLGGLILAALKQVGKDIDHLTPDDLAPVDEFHGGQRQASLRDDSPDLEDRPPLAASEPYRLSRAHAVGDTPCTRPTCFRAADPVV